MTANQPDATKFFAWFDNVSKAALASPVGAKMTATNFSVAHTGGGCLAWERTIDDKAHLWICDEENGLGDKLDEPYMVGLHLTSGEDWIEDQAPSLTDAITWCNDAQHAFELCRKWVRRIGGGFHPDTKGASYVSNENSGWQPLSADEIKEYDADMEKLFGAPGDPYAFGVMAMKEADPDAFGAAVAVKREPSLSGETIRSVYTYFKTVLRQDPQDDTLRELPVDSPCGADCVKVIDAAMQLVAACDPTDHPGIIEIARRDISIKWRG